MRRYQIRFRSTAFRQIVFASSTPCSCLVPRCSSTSEASTNFTTSTIVPGLFSPSTIILQQKISTSSSPMLLPNSDSPLIGAVFAELFRLSSSSNDSSTSSSSSSQQQQQPPESKWINLGLLTKNIPDELLESELEKFKGGIREIIGKYLVSLRLDQIKGNAVHSRSPQQIQRFHARDEHRGTHQQKQHSSWIGNDSTTKELVELKFESETKTWWARTKPVDSDLVKLSAIIEVLLDKVWKNNPFPLQTGDVADFLRHPFVWCQSKKKCVVSPELIKATFSPSDVQENALLFSRLMQKCKGITRAMWLCVYLVPTCRWELFDPMKGERIEVFLVKDHWMRRISSSTTLPNANTNENDLQPSDDKNQTSYIKKHAGFNRVQIELLSTMVPTFFIPMSLLLRELEPQGYTEAHINSFFSLSRNIEIVRLQITNQAYVRLHGGRGEYDMFSLLPTNARHMKFEPKVDGVAQPYVRILQQHFSREVFPFLSANNNHFSTQEEEKHDARKWMSLRHLLERGVPENEKKLCWQGPEAILYFGQLQHIFCFSPDGPDGGSVCLQPYFYEVEYFSQIANFHIAKFRNNNSQRFDGLCVMTPLVPTVLFAQSSPHTILFTELARLLRKRKTISLDDVDVSSKLKRRMVENILADLLQPIFDLAPMENIVPPEIIKQDANGGLVFEKVMKKREKMLAILTKTKSKNLSGRILPPLLSLGGITASSTLLSCQNDTTRNVETLRPLSSTSSPATTSHFSLSYEDYFMLFVRLHSLHFIWDYRESLLYWSAHIHQSFVRNLDINTRVQRARDPNDALFISNPVKLRCLVTNQAKQQDPENPLWNTATLVDELIKYLPTDRYVTIGEFFNFLIPQNLQIFITGGAGPLKLFQKFPEKFVLFQMRKESHFRHLQQQKNLAACHEDYINEIFPAAMFFVDRPNIRFLSQVENYRCVMLRKEPCEETKIKSNEIRENEKNSAGELQLPEGAIPLEVSSEDFAKSLVHLMSKYGLNAETGRPVSGEGMQTTGSAKMDVFRLKHLAPEVRIKGGYRIGKMVSFIGFLELHPDKFVLVGSGKHVDSVVLNPEYFTEKSRLDESKVEEEESFDDDEQIEE